MRAFLQRLFGPFICSVYRPEATLPLSWTRVVAEAKPSLQKRSHQRGGRPPRSKRLMVDRRVEACTCVKVPLTHLLRGAARWWCCCRCCLALHDDGGLWSLCSTKPITTSSGTGETCLRWCSCSCCSSDTSNVRAPCVPPLKVRLPLPSRRRANFPVHGG